MRNENEAPVLEAVGEADQVILGSLAMGNDILDEFLIQNGEFQSDEE